MFTVIIADQQDLTRLGIGFICHHMAIPTTSVSTKKELIQQLTAHPEAVVVLDYSLFDVNGVNELLILQLRFEKAHWVLLSESFSEHNIRILQCNEKFSLVLKDAEEHEIITALSQALQSKPFVCSGISALFKVADGHHVASETFSLTQSEQDILKLIALGKSNKEIAVERFTSVHTVATHRKNIFRKLNVTNVYDAIKYALRAGIVDETEYYI